MRGRRAAVALAVLFVGGPHVSASADPPVATVGTVAIGLAEVDGRCGTPCVVLRTEIVARKWAALETLVGDALLAGVAAAPVPPVTPTELDAYLTEHAADFHGPPERDRAAVAFFLARERRRAVRDEQVAAERARRPPVLHVGPETPALADADPAVPLAEAGGRTIQNAEVETRLKLALYRLRGELALERRRAAEALVEETLWRLEAAARGTTPDALRAEVGARVPPVTDGDVARWVAASSGEHRADRARPYLEFRAQRDAEEAVLAAARRRHAVEIRIADPAVPRFALDAGAGGWRGPPRPRTRVVFLTGYRGTGSRAMWPVVRALGGDPAIALAIRPLLPFWDPEASLVAAAARCAAAQKAFWAFHDAAASRDPLPDAAALERIAADVGLDRDAFRRCVADPATATAVADESAEAERLGFEAAPVVLVDGRAFGGVQGLDGLRAAARGGR
ncbi:MAG TPA: thioredoxin domain-containing protein [Candidatus Binatia bacterium]|nr:thioredoxin domain-containing protein [Candidatus Binatia bacterium]